MLRRIDDETVMLDLKSERYFSLNAVGSRFLSLAEDGCTFTQIVDRIAEEFAAAPTVVAADLDRLIDTLRDLGLLSMSSDDA